MATRTPSASDVSTVYVYCWKKYNPALFGRRCRVISRGSMNSALVEFEDGFKCIVSRNALRRVR